MIIRLCIGVGVAFIWGGSTELKSVESINNVVLLGVIFVVEEGTITFEFILATSTALLIGLIRPKSNTVSKCSMA